MRLRASPLGGVAPITQLRRRAHPDLKPQVCSGASAGSILAPHHAEPSRVTDALLETLEHSLRGSYRVEREIGGGGMSRVFVAEETALSRRVVVKVLSAELSHELSAER